MQRYPFLRMIMRARAFPHLSLSLCVSLSLSLSLSDYSIYGLAIISNQMRCRYIKRSYIDFKWKNIASGK